ncbi:MFS transporter [Amycolatopsis regifaucium]|uniref:MFS transporter n=1 Tax=Amycolatopsis regifaucium TaxID=546365 RepID=A0A154MAD7_9PSEU|nr:MFS transporter [Amycolatopsis regifaucium]KZB81634.1 MFS transporter [Amycolatopsis regifaucium]OKA06303.1 MFS transporter [Amycolatopsis regifaucium]SFG65947.1 Predicted arabinose efflux permease, MFS family [Amycolatopsis regifaucium]
MAESTARSRGDRRLRWLLASSAASNLGDGIGKVAFPLLAVTLTRDPLLIAGLSATQFLPWLLFALPAGALLDRIDRRRAMIFANGARAVVVGGTAVLVAAGGVTIWVVYAAALLIGFAEVVADSAANVLIPAVVDKGSLDSANSKLQACEIVGQTFLGGPVGSATFALFATFPFLLNSVGFAIAAAVLLGLAGSYRPRPAERASTELRAELAEGFRWLKNHRLVSRLVVVAGLISLVSELAQAQLVLYAIEYLGLSEAAFGLFAFVGGIGGLLGAGIAPRLVKTSSRRTVLLGGTACCGAAFAGMGLTSSAVAGAALFGLFAAAVVAVNIVLGTARHTLVPGELLGRVLGVWRTVVWGAIPVGALLGGVLTHALGSPAWTFLTSGLLLFGVAGFAFVSLRPGAFDDESATASRVLHQDR